MAYKKKPKPYLNNKDLLKQYELSVQQDKMTEEMAKMLMLLADRFCTRHNLAGYSYVDDMKSYAMLMLIRQWRAFNPEKTTNAFAFYTQCVKNALYQYLNKEKKHRVIRDELLIDQGLDPSNTYLDQYESQQNDEVVDQKEYYNMVDKRG